MRPRSLLASPISWLALAILIVVIVLIAVAASSGNSPAFNRQTNSPSYGNERLFLSIRDASSSQNQRSLQVKPGQELVATTYFNNDAKDSDQTAKNSRVQLVLPSQTAKDQTVSAYIKADNTKPSTVTAAVQLNASQPITLAYEAGSAQLWNNVWRGQALSDEIVHSGAQIGYNKLDGAVPAGVGYSGYVTVKLKVGAPSGAKAPAGPAGTNVPNTGPGNVVAIFLVVSAASSLWHLNRTAKRNSV